MDIFLTNNLTNKKEQFVPKDNKKIIEKLQKDLAKIKKKKKSIR